MIAFFLILPFVAIALLFIFVFQQSSNSSSGQKSRIGKTIRLWWNNSPESKGKMGEAVIKNILSQLPQEYKVFNDVVFKTKKGTTQIDHIVVSKYGIFAIETKNYRGDIYGDDYRNEWTQLIVTEVTYMKKWYKTYNYVTKNRFYNPVKQAYGHVYEIKRTLYEWPYLNVVPIVVFTGISNLLNVTTKNHVIHDNKLIDTILGYTNICLSDSDIDNITFLLAKNNVRALVDDQTHVQNVMAAQNNANNKITHGICPKCGGKLVKRTGKFGGFYGCSNYPNCKFTTQI